MFNIDTIARRVTGDVDTLIKQINKDRYAMARALVILRKVTERKYRDDETHPAGAVILLLINALETKDARPLLVKGEVHILLEKAE
jgi:hypothetical protein